jgi:DNA (cytosine-5)-methyltransferase 1
VLDLFSGIGGFSLGLERAGMRTVAFCEIDPYCRAVLAKHWPTVPCFTDVTRLEAGMLELAECGGIDLICGGFPCQDISVAGKGAGLAGARSGLWSHFARLIRELRPRWVVIENVSALLTRGVDIVLGDLAEIGYDAEWHCIPATYVGAPHRRDRVWIIAYPGSEGRWQELRGAHGDESAHAGRPSLQMHEPGGHGEERDVADADGRRCEGEWQQEHGEFEGALRRESDRRGSRGSGIGENVADPVCDSDGHGFDGASAFERSGQDRHEGPRRVLSNADHWAVEPNVGRVANGVPSRVDRLKTLGNAVVPQIPEIIGRAIMRAEHG